MKKVVLKLDLHDEKAKQKAMKAVSGLSGIDSVSIDMKDKKLTVMGDIDPVMVVGKLRKLCHTEILTVGPAKEEKKKDESKKDGSNKGEDKKKDPKAEWDRLMREYYYQYPPVNPYYYRSAGEDPTGCVIC